MDLEKTFPMRTYINLGRRGDRRGEMEWRLLNAGVKAERFAAVDSRFVKRMALERKRAEESSVAPAGGAPVRGYENAGRYALALTQRMVIREAKLRGAEAVLIFEDDAILHPNFLALAEALEIPDDWGIFYFGCLHLEEPLALAPGIIRTFHGIDTHAFAVRAPYYDRVIEALDAHGKPKPDHPLASDRFLAALQRSIPTYSCFPNLAWQADDTSDLVGSQYTQYHAGGTQKTCREVSDRTFASMFGAPMYAERLPEPKLGLLFLTRGDVHHPGIWSEFVSEMPDRARVFSHPKSRESLAGGFLEGTDIADCCETAWGTISLVRASLNLLRAALVDPSLTHFVLLSESCIPARPLSTMLAHLRRSPKSRFFWRTWDDASELQKGRAMLQPRIPRSCWRFQSQWWLIDRIAAEWIARVDYTDAFSELPIPDESYFATVLCLLGYPLDDQVVKKEVTWTRWENGAGSPASHSRVGPQTLEDIAESEAWFARKFPAKSDIGSWSLHRAMVL